VHRLRAPGQAGTTCGSIRQSSLAQPPVAAPTVPGRAGEVALPLLPVPAGRGMPVAVPVPIVVAIPAPVVVAAPAPMIVAIPPPVVIAIAAPVCPGCRHGPPDVPMARRWLVPDLRLGMPGPQMMMEDEGAVRQHDDHLGMTDEMPPMPTAIAGPGGGGRQKQRSEGRGEQRRLEHGNALHRVAILSHGATLDTVT
jgi:hypothetical protein